MKTIFKYPIPLEGRNDFTLELPFQGKIIHVGVQNGLPMMWVEFTEGVENVEVKFQLFGTGHEIPERSKYCGTFQLGAFVLHLYRML